MEQETRVTTRGDKELALYELETAFALAVRQRELLENYIKERLHPDKHFYTVGDEPGRKPSLTKEGAELICLPHNLKGHYEWLSGPDNPPMDDSPYQITMKCELENNGKFAGEGVGSASSMITRKDGTRVQRQKDPGLRHNATIKMACKSAYIAATLNSTAASEFFTQDLEDDQTGDFKKKADSDGKEHWCEKHHTKFFKSPKMKAYAHPVKNEDGSPTLDDKGKQIWCSEKAEQPQAKTAVADEPEKKPEPTEPETPPNEAQPVLQPETEETSGTGQGKMPKPQRDPETVKSLADLFKACHNDFGMQPKQVVKELGYSSQSDITETPSQCYANIVALRCG